MFSFRNSSDHEDEDLKIIVIRPGATSYDYERCIQGDLSVRLTEAGRGEVRLLAEELKTEDIRYIYSSPNEPALETAEIISRTLNVPRKRLEGLRNQNQGLWQGMRVDDLRRLQPRIYRQWAESPLSVCPPEGESLFYVTQRVRDAISSITRRHRGGTVGLVVGEPTASLVLCCLKHEEIHHLWDHIGNHGCWEEVDVVSENNMRDDFQKRFPKTLFSR